MLQQIRRFYFIGMIAIIMSIAAPTLSHAATTQQAKKYITELGRDTIDVLKKQKVSDAEKEQALTLIFERNIDFSWVARFVMGRYWRIATPQQKEEYVTQYRRFIVKHYASLFSQYHGAEFTVDNARDDEDDEFSVGMQVKAEASTSEPIFIDYKIRNYPQGFRIFDVVIEGVSMLTTQRSEFNAIIGNNDVQYLIDMLKEKSGQ